MKFLLMCVLVEMFVIISHKIINRLTGDHKSDRNERSLIEIFESGELNSERSIQEQVSEMLSEFENSSSESLSLESCDDMSIVDIERYKEKLRAKNEKLREIVLEVG